MIHNIHNEKEIKNKIFRAYLLLYVLLSATFYNRVPSLSSSMMVPWERCCSGSSTSGSQIVISWFPEHDVMVPKAIRYLTHGTQNVGCLNHVAFNLGA